jgi:hypothetical protein
MQGNKGNTPNSAFTLSKPNSTPYGVTVLCQTFEEEWYVCNPEVTWGALPTTGGHPNVVSGVKL